MRLLWKYAVLCAIWYHSYNSKNVKNTQGGVLLLIKLLKVTLLCGCFSRFLNCTHCTKSRNAPHTRKTYLDFVKAITWKPILIIRSCHKWVKLLWKMLRLFLRCASLFYHCHCALFSVFFNKGIMWDDKKFQRNPIMNRDFLLQLALLSLL